MGFERYRTLRAMADLEEFTIDELAELTRVKPVSIQTILARSDRYVEKVEKVSTGRPGGQPWRYRLRDDGRAPLLAELHDLELEPFRSSGYDTEDGRTPLPMLVAEDFLLQRLPAVDESPRRRELLLDIGRRLAGDLHQTTEDSPDTDKLAQRLETTDWLVCLAEAELKSGSADSGLAADFASRIWPAVLRVADLQLARAFINRVRRSEVFECLPTWRLFPPRAAAGEVTIYDGSPRTTERVQAALRAADVPYATLASIEDDRFRSSAAPLVCVVTIDSPAPPRFADLNRVSRTMDAFTPLVAVTNDFLPAVLDVALSNNVKYLPLQDRADEMIAGTLITPLTQVWSLRQGVAATG